MGTYIESLRTWLLERGYTPGSVKHVLTLAGQLGRWMEGSDVKFSQLDPVAVESFLDALRARCVRRVPGPRGLRPLLDYLDSEGALAFKPAPDSPTERLVVEYRTWLVVDRGLAAVGMAVRPQIGTADLTEPRVGSHSKATSSLLQRLDRLGFVAGDQVRRLGHQRPQGPCRSPALSTQLPSFARNLGLDLGHRVPDEYQPVDTDHVTHGTNGDLSPRPDRFGETEGVVLPGGQGRGGSSDRRVVLVHLVIKDPSDKPPPARTPFSASC